MIGKQAVFTPHDLARLRAGIEEDQTIRSCYRGAPLFRIRHDPVDAEEGIALIMHGMLQAGIYHVKTPVEIADPQAACA